ncbi:MAG TPA: hypothetical protein VFF06_28640 [Polyangia bacterium]|nr:hypothetical protein [Polyangia bacterium]
MSKAPAKSRADDLRELERELPKVPASAFDDAMRRALQVPPEPDEKPKAKSKSKAKKAKR